jgi:hypothetical protein
MLSYEFVILEVNGASCEFALDDIYWEGGITGIQENQNDVARHSVGFGLENNYPDPFSSNTTIGYIIPNEVHVELTIFDMDGRIVQILVNKTQSAGTHKVNWIPNNEPSGMYFYKIKAGDFVDIKKCVLLR